MKSKILVSVLLSILLLSIGVFTQDINITLPEKRGHPKLESVLYQLTQAEDYSEFAQTRSLYVVDNKVRVIIELVNVEYNLSSEFGVEETRYENLLQALVHIDKLLDLADDQNIRFIRTPTKYFPWGEGEVTPKETPIYVYYLTGIGIIAILFLVYYFLKKRK